MDKTQGIHGQNKSSTRYTWTKQVKHKVYMDKTSQAQGVHGQNTRYTWTRYTRTKQVKHKVHMDKTSQAQGKHGQNKSRKDVQQIDKADRTNMNKRFTDKSRTEVKMHNGFKTI